jgi:hypothetical protein
MPRGSSFPRPTRVNIVIGQPILALSPAHGGDVHQSGEPREQAETRRRARVGRAATTEQSARVRAAIQQAFDSAEASLRR